MRKRLAAAAVAASVAGILVTSAPLAHADTGSCYSPAPGYYQCYVEQVTAAGNATAAVQWDGNNGGSEGNFWNTSGYSMNGWIQIDYGNGYVTVWSASLPDGTARGQGGFDDSGFPTRACFQFTSWSGAAIHCTQGV